MNTLEKQLPSKTDFFPFLELNCSNFKLEQLSSKNFKDFQKCQRNSKNIKEVNFEGVWDELQSKKSLQR